MVPRHRRNRNANPPASHRGCEGDPEVPQFLLPKGKGGIVTPNMRPKDVHVKAKYWPAGRHEHRSA